MLGTTARPSPAPAPPGCRAKVTCSGGGDSPNKATTLADLLRLKMPTLPHCPDGQTAGHCAGGADRRVDITHVVATRYRKLPRYIERRALINKTYDINPHGAEAVGGSWCQLPVAAEAAWPTIIGGIGDSGTRTLTSTSCWAAPLVFHGSTPRHTRRVTFFIFFHAILSAHVFQMLIGCFRTSWLTHVS